MGPLTVEVLLTDEERQVLLRWARRPTSSQALELRCRMVLACAEGASHTRSGAELGVHPTAVAKWRKRFAADRLEGLVDAPRPGAPRTVGDDRVEDVIVRILESTPGRHTLVDEIDGPGHRSVTVGCLPDLADVWPQAAHDGAWWRSSHCPTILSSSMRPVTSSTSTWPRPSRPGPLRGREVPNPGAGPVRIGAADDARHARAPHPRLPARRNHTLFASLTVATGEVIGQLHGRHPRHRDRTRLQPGPGLVIAPIRHRQVAVTLPVGLGGPGAGTGPGHRAYQRNTHHHGSPLVASSPRCWPAPAPAAPRRTNSWRQRRW
ncbi:helix-turn-helix domain-containing protein [Streptomyces spectabilis]|nr:helix-turn-helix domain-containing protein [Streptomyces spectabilis]